MTQPAGSLNLRRASPGDEAFLMRLFRETNTGLLHLPPSLRESLAQLQYRARDVSYQASHPGAEDWILCLESGDPIGRQLVAQTHDALRILDLAILPLHQGQGIGSLALQGCMERAVRQGMSLRLSVAQGNPAERLYRRLGFELCAEDSLNREMIWSCKPSEPIRFPADQQVGSSLR